MRINIVDKQGFVVGIQESRTYHSICTYEEFIWENCPDKLGTPNYPDRGGTSWPYHEPTESLFDSCDYDFGVFPLWIN